MNLPNLPTDNLYKFIALSGVAFALACGGLIALRDVHLLETWTENVISVKYLQIQGEVPQKMLDVVQKSLDAREKPLSDEEFDRVYAPLFEEIRDIQGGLNEQLQRLVPDSANLASQAMVTIRWRGRLVYGFWSGIAVAVLGFTLWYFRLQRYQDMIVKKQALENTKES